MNRTQQFTGPEESLRNLMSTIQEVSAEQLAKLFHHYREALTHDCGAHGTKEERSTWERTPQNERKLMVAAARLTLLDLSTAIAQPEPGRKYYATPGEAEWGC
ncbi:MAG: hypothetical protein WA741_24055 [Candidatus Sulfotelmatobacter sp.]|jgi:hypothetical protein